MAIKIPYEEKDTLFTNISLNSDLFEKDFKLVNDVFALFEGLKEFIEAGEKRSSQKGELTTGWHDFLSDFYSKYNSTRNMFIKVIKGSPLNEMDFDYLIENTKWVVGKVCRVFQEKEGIPYAKDALLAGRFYNRLFYTIHSNQESIHSHLKIADSTPSIVMNITEKEYVENMELLNRLNKGISENENVVEDEIYTKEEQEKIAVMWYRTVDIAAKEIYGILENVENVKKETI